ncbi:VanZ like family protein [Pseudobutyrivibrio sp. YE44]|uniref:VanZ family protein n=1 Tax=Pseudobutyrivibrio sp. YE44 TaxID=1520802 RepID=UPI00088C969C|nr:VanZ family protein [Pseudobutyrivibrio sp. YE44]SDB34156.1 VanZ like family protein [Pseudobutyrivibrio sp. YE44]
MELNSFYDLYANNWITNLVLMIGATAIAFLLARLLPIVDYNICEKVGLNLQGGVSRGRRASLFKWVRRGILFGAFCLYIVLLIFLVLLVRKENPDYVVRNAGFSLFTMTAKGIDLPAEEFIEFYLNVMIFIPMGYMLPYLFRWFRIHALRRPLIFCFLASVTIENIQLITKRGSYDTADVISNTLGGAIGIALFIMRAYTLTNPEWKKDYRNYRRWKKLAKNGIMYPFVRKLNVRRVTIKATDEEEIWKFYAKDLGFQLNKFLVPEDSKECRFLFGLGRTQLEIFCLNDKSIKLPKQAFTLSYENLDVIKAKLQKEDLPFEDFQTDPYTNHRMIKIIGPDEVEITLLEL